MVLLKSVTGNSFASLHFEYLLGETAVREIVKDCCSSSWNCQKATEMPEKTENDWVNIANYFYRRTQFPNCIGAVDGKHVRIKMPTRSGSLFYNYKHFFSILLLALVDANYCFITVDVGAIGKSSDSNVFKKSNIGRKLESNQLGIPGSSKPLPNDENGKCMPFVIVGDEAFALSEHVLRPYPNSNISVQQRIYNYRLTRARRMVECAVGILANKWRIFH
jgi:hypothetical protein